MIERVVVPVDFSTESDRALMVAPVLAKWAGVSVELVTVAEPEDRAGVEAGLAALASSMSDDTTWRVLESGGPADAALLTELHRDEKALWCVGSHARSKWSELFVRSVSEDLVRESHVPVVLVGPNVTEPPSGRVVGVALDGSTESEIILPVAADVAMAFGMTLRLLQVADTRREDMPADAIETGYLAHVASRARSVMPGQQDYDILHGGQPARDLAGYVAAQPDVGLVALATRGLSGRARLLHGGTAFELAHRAVVPVVILHHV